MAYPPQNSADTPTIVGQCSRGTCPAVGGMNPAPTSLSRTILAGRNRLDGSTPLTINDGDTTLPLLQPVFGCCFLGGDLALGYFFQGGQEFGRVFGLEDIAPEDYAFGSGLDGFVGQL